MRKNKMQNVEFNNFKMNKDVYALRRKVINIIYDLKKAVPTLPRVDVRIGNHVNDKRVLGQGKMKECKVWITEKAVNMNTDELRHIVAHELGHAVLGLEHDDKCPLMKPTLAKPLDQKQCVYHFAKYFNKRVA